MPDPQSTHATEPALVTAQLAPALAAAVFGIPAGLGLYTLAAHVASTQPAILSLLAVIPGTLLTVAALTAVPARVGASRPVAGCCAPNEDICTEVAKALAAVGTVQI